MQESDLFSFLRDCKRTLTFEDVRSILCISESTLRRWVADGKLKFFRLGRQLRFDPAVIIEALRERAS